MDDFYTTMQSVIIRPGMYGISKVEDIDLFIIGYAFGAKDNEDLNLDKFQKEFREFVTKRYNFKWQVLELDGAPHWSRLIRFFSASDVHSLNLFKDNFEEFFLKINKQQNKK